MGKKRVSESESARERVSLCVRERQRVKEIMQQYFHALPLEHFLFLFISIIKCPLKLLNPWRTQREHLTQIYCKFVKKWAIPGLFFFILVFSIQLTEKEYSVKNSPMTGFELETSGFRSDHSVNWATTTATNVYGSQSNQIGLFWERSWL